MERENAKDFLIITATLAALCIIIKSIGKVLLLAVIPFAVAWIVSVPVKPLSSFLSKKLKLKRSFCSAVLVILIISFLFLFFGYLASTLVTEAGDLANDLMSSLDENDNLLNIAFEKVNSINARMPHGSENSNVSSAVYDGLKSLLRNSLESLSNGLAKVATSFIGKMPSFVFALITTVISLFYITASDNPLISENALPSDSKYAITIKNARDRAVDAIKKYARSYFIILLITFAELFLGFVILRVEYALLLALITAVIDFLPIVGTGIIIIPWSVVCMLTGNIRRGVGLLLLWVIMYIVRQFIEPRIVGSVMGIHPIASLFAIYLGFVSCGFAGMILFPILLYIIKASMSRKDRAETS